MIEFPEALSLAGELSAALAGKTVESVLPPTKQHRFCWFLGDPAEYGARLRGQRFLGAEGFGIYMELSFSGGLRLAVNDGVNPRLLSAATVPKDYQLLVVFTDGAALALTVAMYGGIILHDGSYDNEYYLKSRAALSPLSAEFPAYYRNMLAISKPSLSAKAFLATEQRFPGIGNGVLQDILFAAGIHPKRRIGTLSPNEGERLLAAVVSVLGDMAAHGGRDTEKGVFGAPGGYATKMSKNTLGAGCPACGGDITKEAYLGGAVYYCPRCQPLE